MIDPENRKDVGILNSKNAMKDRNNQFPVMLAKDKDPGITRSFSTLNIASKDQLAENGEREHRLLSEICGASSSSDEGCTLRLLQPGKKNKDENYFGIYLKIKKEDQKIACHSLILAIPTKEAASFTGIEWKITDGCSSICKDLDSLSVINGDEKLSVWDAKDGESREIEVFVPFLKEDQIIEFPSGGVLLKAPFKQDGLEISAEMEIKEFSIGSNGPSGNLRFHLLLIRKSALPYPINWSFSLGENIDKEADFNHFKIIDSKLRFSFQSNKSPREMSLPIITEGVLKGDLSLELPGFSKASNLKATLIALMSNISMDLGSPLARLKIQPETKDARIEAKLDIDNGFNLNLATKFESWLYIDIFKVFDENGKEPILINNAYSSDGNMDWLISINKKSVSNTDLKIKWISGHLVFKRDLFGEIINDAIVNVIETRKLIALNGKVLASSEAVEVAFSSGNNIGFEKPFNCSGNQELIDSNYLFISLAANMKWKEGRPIFKATGKFYFKFYQEEDNIILKPGTFSCVEENLLTVEDDYYSEFSELISLDIPKGTAFIFTNEPADPRFALCPNRADAASPITLSIASSINFDINEFSIQSCGFDLKGNVRAGSVTLGEGTGIDGAIQVKGVDQKEEKDKGQRRIGEIEFKCSKLVYCRINAIAKLVFFDDAVGNLDLSISQKDESGLQCIGTLELADVVEFHVAALFATFQINHPTFSISYQDRNWKANGNMSGMIKFEPPAGHSASEAGALSELFQGLSLQFSDLNPTDLDPTNLKIKNVMVTFLEPKRFGFAEIMSVELKGIKIEGNKKFVLLGGISIKELPGVDSSLTLEGIELEANPAINFKVRKIHAELALSDAFKMNGSMEFFEEGESGFGGKFALDCGFLPKADFLIKLTSIKSKDGSLVPSLVVYAEKSVDNAQPLVDNIYLRRIGLGLGLRQSLRGLEPDNPKPIPERVHDLIMDPAGLPEPSYLSSWNPVHPERANSPLFWMLVASAQLTFSYFEKNQPHLLAGTILLALSQERIVMAGAKIWLLSSPDDIQTPGFSSNPAGQAAIMISLKEQSIAAEFKTKKGSEMTKKIPLIKEILDMVEISAKLSADRHGFMLNIGYPHEIKVNYKIFGGIKAELAAGFMFMNYRGITLTSMKMRTSLKAGAALSITAGPATASLTANAELSCSASFDGVLDSQMRPCLYADMEVKGSMEINAGVSLRIKLGKGRFSIKKDISLGSVTVKAEIGAFLAAAMNHDGKFGYFGIITLKIPACGHNFYPSIPIGDGKDMVTGVHEKIESYKNSFGIPSIPVTSPEGLTRLPAAEEKLLTAKKRLLTEEKKLPGSSQSPSCWRYYWFRYELKDKTGIEKQTQVRVLIFPAAGKAYPSPDAETGKRFHLNLKSKDKFLGFAGLKRQRNDIEWSENLLKWSENLEEKIISKEDLLKDREDLRSKLKELEITPKDEYFELEDYKLSHLLKDIKKENEMVKETEISDSRVKNPIFSDFDDDYRELATDGFRSPHFSADSEYDRRLKEACSNGNCRKESFLASWDQDLRGIIKALVDGEMHDQMRNDLTRELKHIGISDCDLKKLGTLTASLSDAKDLIWTLKLEGEGCTASDLGLLIKYNGTQISAYLIDYEDGLDSSLIFNELLALLKDTRALDKDEYKDEYLLAKNMRLILEFNEPDETHDDPVPYLIDLYSVHRLGGEECRLKKNALDKEYDLIPGWDFQDKDKICLDWELQLEETPDLTETFQELEVYVIKRQNLSRPETGMIEESRHPCWIRGKDGTIFKPRFQFSDNNVKDIKEGDLLQYTIEARSTDRILATTVFIFERKYLMPLKTLGQAVALQSLRGDNIEFSIILNESLEDDLKEDSLIIQFRLASISSYGSYGFESGKGLSDSGPQLMIEPANGLGSSQSVADLSIPWSETFLLDGVEWDKMNEKEKIVGYRAEVSWEKIFEAVGASLNIEEEAAEQVLRQGKAIEFFVGREIKNKSEPLQRSPLSRCRHAIIRSLDAIDDDNPISRLNLGNTVSAIELIKQRGTVADFADPLFICAKADHGDILSDAYKPNVMIEIDWRHDSEVMEQEQPNPEFNPVIGYCLHRVDAQDPVRYQQVASGSWYDTPEIYVEVVPETFYRSNPSTVTVQTDDWKPIQKEDPSENDGKISSVANGFSFEPLSGYGPCIFLETSPIWLHTDLKNFFVKLAKKLGDEYSCMLVLNSPILQRPKDDKEDDKEDIKKKMFELFEVFLKKHSPKIDPYGWRTAEALGISCECIFLDKDRIPVNAERIKMALQEFSNEQSMTTCFFQREDRRTLLNVVRVIYWNPLSDLEQFFKEALLLQLLGYHEDGGEIELPDSIKGRLSELKWIDDLKKRLRSSCLIVDEISKSYRCITFRQVVRGLTTEENGLPGLEKPVASVVLPINSEGVISYRLPVGDNWAHKYIIAIEKIRRYDRIWEMPYVFEWDNILREGMLIEILKKEFDINLGDGVNIEKDNENIIKIFDDSKNTVSLELNIEKTEVALKIGDDLKDKFMLKIENGKKYIYIYSKRKEPLQDLNVKTKEVSVHRTEPLQADGIMGTPIAGGIQAIVLRNPAAFAASASAINAVRMQYSGQTIILERRNPEEEILKEIYKNFSVHMRNQETPLNWNLYKEWLDKNKYEEVEPGPTFDSIGSNNSGIFKASEMAIFGADRYIMPDLPAYYEYRVAVCSNAGLRRSSYAFSPWMQPMWEDGKEEEVQCPKTYVYTKKINGNENAYYIRHAYYSPKSRILNLKLALVHYRFHMPEDLRPLWVDSDKTLKMSDSESDIKLGSLPDLHLEYRIYLIVNPEEKPRICLPMLRILPPMAKKNGNTIGRYEPEYLIDSLEILNKSFGLAQAQAGQDIDEKEIGELQFDIDLKLDSEDFRAFTQKIEERYKSSDNEIDVTEFIGIQVSSLRGSSSSIYLPKALKE